MNALTVLGPVPAEALGLTLMHEHLLFDFSMCLSSPRTTYEESMAREPVSVATLGALRFNPCVVADNLVQGDVELAIKEVGAFVAVGGRTLVDPTNGSIGRNPLALQTVARATGLNIVMGAGYYYQVALDAVFAGRALADIHSEITRDVITGVGDSGVRAGLIGEIGTSAPITPDEEKSLRASARAQADTGAPLMVHLDGWGREGNRVIDLIMQEGGRVERTILCHMNPSSSDPDYQMSLADRGAYLEYDMLGINHFYPPDRASPDELVALEALRRLLDRGYQGRILLSQDVYLKMMLTRYGGHGYAHLFTNMQPLFQQAGITGADLQVLLTDNPQRALAFV